MPAASSSEFNGRGTSRNGARYATPPTSHFDLMREGLGFMPVNAENDGIMPIHFSKDHAKRG